MIDRFMNMCCEDSSIWYCETINRWIPYDGETSTGVPNAWLSMSNCKKCHSLKAFRRNLKKIAKTQPELIGKSFTLWNEFYETTKRGNCKNLDITMKVRIGKNENNL